MKRRPARQGQEPIPHERAQEMAFVPALGAPSSIPPLRSDAFRAWEKRDGSYGIGIGDEDRGAMIVTVGVDGAFVDALILRLTALRAKVRK